MNYLQILELLPKKFEPRKFLSVMRLDVYFDDKQKRHKLKERADGRFSKKLFGS